MGEIWTKRCGDTGAALEDTVAGAEGGEASEPELQEAVLKESSTQRRAVSDSGRP